MGARMTDTGTPDNTAPAAQQDAPPTDAPDAADDQQQDTTDWKAEARKWEARAKENTAAAKQAEKARLAAMTDAERAVAEAEARGRTAASSEFGKRLARTEFDAAAGRRNPTYDSAKALEYVDLARFVGDDGEPDVKAIKAAVEHLVPAPADGPPDFDGGTRTSTPPTNDINALLRKAAGRA